MALIKCPECGAQISDKAEACPHCGAPVASKTAVHTPNVSATCRLSPVFFVGNVLLAVILLIVATSLFATDAASSFVWFVIAAVYVLWNWLKYKRTYVSISNGIVTGHLGIINSRKLVSPIGKVQDISISNGLLGKIFGYHTVVVMTAGTNGAEYLYKYMANAKKLQAAFVEASRNAG
ncbi:MAG: zinc-ribbon domain-containing protein [Clostridiales bacterium]|nr:zinc-ribbon domain-containing protein [Clostridiales bacterium]